MNSVGLGHLDVFKFEVRLCTRAGVTTFDAILFEQGRGKVDRGDRFYAHYVYAIKVTKHDPI